MNNETWLKIKGIPISQLVKEGMQCYITLQYVNAYCKGVILGIDKVKPEFLTPEHVKDILNNIQNITKQAKCTYYEKIEKEE